MNAVQSVVAKLFSQAERYLSTRRHSLALDGCNRPPRIDNFAAAESWGMTDQQDDPLAQFGLDAIDLRWTSKDIDSKRTWLINKDHLPKLIQLGLVEMREGTTYLTTVQHGWRKWNGRSHSHHPANAPVGIFRSYEVPFPDGLQRHTCCRKATLGMFVDASPIFTFPSCHVSAKVYQGSRRWQRSCSRCLR
jgi:hypothetical protein